MLSLFRKLGNNRKGFTLMELIIVMAVIGILVALAIPKFSEFKDKALLTNVKNDLKVMENLVATNLLDLGVEYELDFKDTQAELVNKFGDSYSEHANVYEIPTEEGDFEGLDNALFNAYKNSNTQLSKRLNGDIRLFVGEDGTVYIQNSEVYNIAKKVNK